MVRAIRSRDNRREELEKRIAREAGDRVGILLVLKKVGGGGGWNSLGASTVEESGR